MRKTKESNMSSDLFRRHPTRREFLTIGTGLFVALSMPLALRRRIPHVKRSFPLMGTIAEVQVRTATRAWRRTRSTPRWRN
jgi:hypothetical protein